MQQRTSVFVVLVVEGLLSDEFKCRNTDGDCVYYLLPRLGMMWPGAEPERGNYNESYFKASKSLVNRYAEFVSLRVWL